MENDKNQSLYEQAEQWLKTLYSVHVTESAIARRFGIGIFEAAALAESLEAAGILGCECPPFGQRKNRVRRRGKHNRKAV